MEARAYDEYSEYGNDDEYQYGDSEYGAGIQPRHPHQSPPRPQPPQPPGPPPAPPKRSPRSPPSSAPRSPPSGAPSARSAGSGDPPARARRNTLQEDTDALTLKMAQRSA